MAQDVDLGPLERVVDELVLARRYGSRDEVLREGVRLLAKREAGLASLDQAIHSGLADTASGRLTSMAELFGRLEAKYTALADAKDA